ncbi:MAG: hypothetical protein SVM79_03395 [Chloroflexota bacterium]|nr:hypothetical protein [Chloroflexota bacterium]
MSEESKHSYICDKCGNEAEMTIKEDDKSTEHHHEFVPKKGILVCKVCGNEAEMILEEM